MSEKSISSDEGYIDEDMLHFFLPNVTSLVNSSMQPGQASPLDEYVELPNGTITILRTVNEQIFFPGDLKDIVNVTKEFPLGTAKVLLGYMLPIVFVITIITNGMIVIVLTQRHMRTPTNIVLFTMAIVDTMTLLWPSPWYIYIYTLGYYDEFIYPPSACLLHYHMTDVIPSYFHTASIWLALLLAGQRYIYVCHPILARTWCTVPRVRKAIFIILTLAFIHHGTRLFDSSFAHIYIQKGKKLYNACRVDVAAWVGPIYYPTYYTIRLLFVNIIPCTALITLNSLLFRALRRAEAKRTELLRKKFKLVGGNHKLDKQNHSHHHSYRIHQYSVVQNDNTTIARDNSSFNSANAACEPKIDKTDAKNAINDHGAGQQAQDIAPGQASVSRNNNTVLDPVASIAGSDNSIPSSQAAMHACTERKKSTKRKFGQGESDPTIDSTVAAVHGGGSKADENGTNDEGNEDEELRIFFSKDDESGDQDEDDDEDISVCPDCIPYERDDGASSDLCPRCSAMLIDTDKTSTRDGPSALRNRTKLGELNKCQTISQCSSLIGVATHTTTNEDTSSCQATQNQVNEDATLYAVDGGDDGDEHDEHGDGHEHHVGATHGEGSSLESAEFYHQSDKKFDNCCGPKTGGEKMGELNRSNSADSRLACGCRLSKARDSSRRASGQRAKRRPHDCVACTRSKDNFNSNDSSQESHNYDKKAVSVESAQQSHLSSSSSSMLQAHDSKADIEGDESASSSASDLYANYYSQASRTNELTPTGKRVSDWPSQHGKRSHVAQNLRDTKESGASNNAHMDYAKSHGTDFDRVLRTCSPAAAAVFTAAAATTTTTTTTAAAAAAAATATATTTTTTTTTTNTTLYSGNATTAAPLLHLLPRSGNALNGNLNQQIGSTANILNRMKSPSFASSTGRGSRATLLGAPETNRTVIGKKKTPPPLIVSDCGITAQASTRTIDSNRTTLMLIVVLTVFLMIEIPIATIVAKQLIMNVQEESANYFKLFTNFLIAVSCSINFSIYYSMSKKFRETFRSLIMCRDREAARQAQRLAFRSATEQHQYQLNQGRVNFETSQYNTPQTMGSHVNISNQYDEQRYALSDIERGRKIKKPCAQNANNQTNTPSERYNPESAYSELITKAQTKDNNNTNSIV